MSTETGNNSTPPAMTTQHRIPAAIGPRGISLQNYDDLVRFATAVSRSGLAPKGIQTPEAIFVAIQMGLEVGLSPMAALQNIAVINGRPSIWGDAQLGIVRATGDLEEFSEWYEVDGKRLPRNPSAFTDNVTAVCRVKRRGQEPLESGFAVSDAKSAGLWGKEGPWRQYPARMLRFRARSFALRDTFGDALKGLRSAEEAQDTPDEINVTPDPSQFAGWAAAAPLPVPSQLAGETPKRRGRPPKTIVAPVPGAANADTPQPAPRVEEPATTEPAEPAEPAWNPETVSRNLKTLEGSLLALNAGVDELIEAAVGDGMLGGEGQPDPKSISSLKDLPPAIVEYYLGANQLTESINFIRQTR